MNTSALLRDALEVEKRWPMIDARNLMLKMSLPDVRAMVRVADEARRLLDNAQRDGRIIAADFIALRDALDALEGGSL